MTDTLAYYDQHAVTFFALTASVDEQGRYILKLPYADHRELIMDILKFGADVEVLEPDSLRQLVREEHERAAMRYSAGQPTGRESIES